MATFLFPGTGYSIKVGRDWFENVGKDIISDVKHATLYEIGIRVREKARRNFYSRTTRGEYTASRGDMPRSVIDTLDFTIVDRKNRVDFEIGAGYKYVDILDSPKGTITEISSSPRPFGRYKLFQTGEWKTFSPGNPVFKRGTAFFSDALSETIDELDSIIDEVASRYK